MVLEVVPESGSDQLTGLTGTLAILIEDEQHFYDFDYELIQAYQNVSAFRLTIMKTRVLVLFPNSWDRGRFANQRYSDQYEFFYLGLDFFSFPNYLLLPFFRVNRFIRRTLRFLEKHRIDTILSSDEYIGAILAGVLSCATGRPGTDPEKIILAQHKYFSRTKQREAVPHASVQCALIDVKQKSFREGHLPFPFFVKPVKGTFSLFAKKVADHSELRKHLSFNWLERRIFRTINRPFNQLLAEYSNLNHDANYFVAEELIEGQQVTVDGFVFNGEVIIAGIVDSVMFENTSIFERFEYPSRLSAAIQVRMAETVRSLAIGLGFRSAQFNVELFYNRRTDRIYIIEINPRLSYQFADLYENVDGTNSYDVLLALAAGKRPAFTKGDGPFNHSASFVLRTFQGKKLTALPDPREIEVFNQKYPESIIKIYGKRGTRLAGEIRAIGSYRYGIVNIGARTLLDLFAIYEDAKATLTFDFK